MEGGLYRLLCNVCCIWMISKYNIIMEVDLNAVTHWLGAHIKSALDIIAGIVIFYSVGSNCIAEPVLATGIDVSTSSWRKKHYWQEALFTNVYRKGCVWCDLITLTIYLSQEN